MSLIDVSLVCLMVGLAGFLIGLIVAITIVMRHKG